MFLCAFDFFLLIFSLEYLQVESRDVDLRLANRETVKLKTKFSPVISKNVKAENCMGSYC